MRWHWHLEGNGKSETRKIQSLSEIPSKGSMAAIIGNRKVIGFRNLVSDEALARSWLLENVLYLLPLQMKEMKPLRVLDFSKRIPLNSEDFS